MEHRLHLVDVKIHVHVPSILWLIINTSNHCRLVLA